MHKHLQIPPYCTIGHVGVGSGVGEWAEWPLQSPCEREQCERVQRQLLPVQPALIWSQEKHLAVPWCLEGGQEGIDVTLVHRRQVGVPRLASSGFFFRF